jgi:predicted nucleic acid-binding protein
LIYVDTSVALAYLLGETRSPPASFWGDPLVSSRLLEYEVWNRLHARGTGLAEAQKNLVIRLLGHVDLIELSPDVLARALKPFPMPVRTLDALHIATMEFLRAQGRTVELVSYDNRLLAGAKAMGIPLVGI